MSSIADTSAGNSPRPRRLTPLWGLVAVVVLPMLAAVVLYSRHDWLPQGLTNHGELITPPIPLADHGLMRTDGSGKLALGALHGDWLMVALADADCGEACRKRTYDLRQIRLATGAERDRVQRIVVFTAPPAATALARLRDAYPRLPLTQAPPDTARLGLDGAPGTVYLIDPMGNLMMRYTPSAPASDILKDLKHLLRISQGWR